MARLPPGVSSLGQLQGVPEQLAAYGGVDLRDPGFWAAGRDLIEARLTEAEAASAAVTP